MAQRMQTVLGRILKGRSRKGGEPAGCDIAAIRRRVRELGTDPARGFIRAEGIGGYRIEKYLGRTIQRSADEPADFVDEVIGPISLKGPIPARGSVEALANSAIKDVRFNSATRAVFVNLRGLDSIGQTQVRSMVHARIQTPSKPVYFLD
jgi:hypothetical protein